MIVLLYIWILVKAYLQLGLFIATAITLITLIRGTIDRMWLKNFVFTVFLHPVVLHYLIKELQNGK